MNDPEDAPIKHINVYAFAFLAVAAFVVAVFVAKRDRFDDEYFLSVCEESSRDMTETARMFEEKAVEADRQLGQGPIGGSYRSLAKEATRRASFYRELAKFKPVALNTIVADRHASDARWAREFDQQLDRKKKAFLESEANRKKMESVK